MRGVMSMGWGNPALSPQMCLLVGRSAPADVEDGARTE